MQQHYSAEQQLAAQQVSRECIATCWGPSWIQVIYERGTVLSGGWSHKAGRWQPCAMCAFGTLLLLTGPWPLELSALRANVPQLNKTFFPLGSCLQAALPEQLQALHQQLGGHGLPPELLGHLPAEMAHDSHAAAAYLAAQHGMAGLDPSQQHAQQHGAQLLSAEQVVQQQQQQAELAAAVAAHQAQQQAQQQLQQQLELDQVIAAAVAAASAPGGHLDAGAGGHPPSQGL